MTRLKSHGQELARIDMLTKYKAYMSDELILAVARALGFNVKVEPELDRAKEESHV